MHASTITDSPRKSGRSPSRRLRHWVTRSVASRNDLDLGAQTLRREAAFPSNSDRSLRTVARDNWAEDPDAILAKPHEPGAYHLLRIHLVGNFNDRLLAVIFDLVLSEGTHLA